MAHELRLCSHICLFVCFWMWNSSLTTWWNGDRPTTAFLLLLLLFPFCSILNGLSQKRGTNRNLTAVAEHFRLRTSQLFALQHGLSGGAGEEDRAGLGCGEHWLDVKPLARQSGVAAARARSLPHGGRDALVPLCWRCSRQLVLPLGVPRYKRCTSLIIILTIDVQSARARYNSSFVFGWNCVPARVIFLRWLDKETNVSCCVLSHTEIDRNVEEFNAKESIRSVENGLIELVRL